MLQVRLCGGWIASVTAVTLLILLTITFVGRNGLGSVEAQDTSKIYDFQGQIGIAGGYSYVGGGEITGVPCEGDFQTVTDFIEGAQLELKNSQFETIGTSTLTQGVLSPPSVQFRDLTRQVCMFTFDFPEVPVSSFYVLSIGNHPYAATFSFRQLTEQADTGLRPDGSIWYQTVIVSP